MAELELQQAVVALPFRLVVNCDINIDFDGAEVSTALLNKSPMTILLGNAASPPACWLVHVALGWVRISGRLGI
jgi:hypothetical protein